MNFGVTVPMNVYGKNPDIISIKLVNDPCCYKFLMTSLVFNHHREMPRAKKH